MQERTAASAFLVCVGIYTKRKKSRAPAEFALADRCFVMDCKTLGEDEIVELPWGNSWPVAE